jgi:hypothetical protein
MVIKLYFTLFILFFFLDFSYCKIKELPNLSIDEIRCNLDNKNFDLFDKILKNAEKELENFKMKVIPKELFNYQNSFKQQIIERSMDSNSQCSFSFLSMKKKGKIIPDATTFFGNSNYETLCDKLPMNGKAIEPWSASYWPARNAYISARYCNNDKNTIGIFDKKTQKYSRYFAYKESAGMYIQPDEINKISPKNLENQINSYFSPSEKLDYLLCDKTFALTNYLKNFSKQFSKDGDIPTWFGVCHGWAPAAYYFAKPLKPIKLYACDGKTRIEFLPDDIKALATQFWANATYKTRFVGSICPFNDPKKINSDKETGLWLDERCAAINPATFIIIIANQMGIKKLNLIFDPKSDDEKWNQPIYSYSMRYFNILNNQFYSSCKEAKISVDKLKGTNDKFLNFLARTVTSQTTHVIGVLIEVTYSIEVNPVHDQTSTKNFFKTDKFIAAIFLDKLGNLIGGQWKYNLHPNFMWKHEETIPPSSVCDDKSQVFSGSVSSLKNLAPNSLKCSKNGQLIKVIIDYLIKLSCS